MSEEENSANTSTKPIRASGNIKKSYIAETVDSSESSSSESSSSESGSE